MNITTGWTSKLSASALAALLAVGMAGCEQQPRDKQAASGKLGEQQAVAIQSTQSDKRLIVTEATASYVLPPCDSKQQPCPQINISHAVTNLDWVNQFLDEQILAQYATLLNGKQVRPKDPQQLVNGFLAQIKPGDPATANFSEKLDTVFLGMYKDMGMFMISRFSYYQGAAQPFESKRYYVLDLDRKRQLLLDDLLVSGKQQALYDLIYVQFKQWVQKSTPSASMQEYERDNPFTVTGNFSFNKDGIEFLYNAQELGAFTQGAAVFTIPYGQLKGIVKDRYLKD